MSEPERVSNWNVPNALTTLRLVMVPFFGWALLHDGGHDTTWRWVAWALFVVAMITDKVDGDLARKHNLITNFGKIVDPIADKAMTGMAFIGLAIIHDFMPAWLWWTVTVVVLLREWAVTIARLSDRQGRRDAGQAERQGEDRDAGDRAGRVHRPVRLPHRPPRGLR